MNMQSYFLEIHITMVYLILRL